jgi:hypothetical protein
MPKKKSSERSPKNKERTDMSGFRMIGIRVSNEYAGWLDRAAKHGRLTVAAFLDRAAAAEAKASGFEEVPPDRIR